MGSEGGEPSALPVMLTTEWTMSAKAEEGEKPAEVKPQKSVKKLAAFAAIGLVSLVGGAGVATVFMPASAPVRQEEPEFQEPVETVANIQTADLGQFIVNLSDMTSFLKVQITIEYDASLLDRRLNFMRRASGGKAHGGGASGGSKEAQGGGMHPLITKKEHQFRDAIIRILSAKKADELLTVNGKARVKEELLDGLNEAVGGEEPAIREILFTDFMIQ